MVTVGVARLELQGPLWEQGRGKGVGMEACQYFTASGGEEEGCYREGGHYIGDVGVFQGQ